MNVYLISFLLSTSLLMIKPETKKKNDCKPFLLHIKADGIAPDSMSLSYPDCMKNNYGKKISLVNGQATIEGHVNYAAEVVLFTDLKSPLMDGPKVIRFIIEPGTTSISFRLTDGIVNNLKIDGSKAQAEKEIWDENLQASNNLEDKYADSIRLLSRTATDSQKVVIRQHYNKQIQLLRDQRVANAAEYLSKYPSGYFSAYLLRHYQRRFSIDSVQAYYMRFSAETKKSDLAKEILAEALATTKDANFIKQSASPEFSAMLEKVKGLHDISLPGKDGKLQHLSSLKGKYVLLDFWGSWCQPCFQNIPHLKKIEEEFKGRPLSFVSISIDTDIKKWKESLNKYNFPGINLIDTSQLTVAVYQVPWVPKYVIVDPDGKILHANAPSPQNGELKELLHSVVGK